jgi:hypothetical protein
LKTFFIASMGHFHVKEGKRNIQEVGKSNNNPSYVKV